MGGEVIEKEGSCEALIYSKVEYEGFEISGSLRGGSKMGWIDEDLLVFEE